MPRPRHCSGFSLIETIVAMALTLLISAIILALVDQARASFALQPDAADLQQRVRVAADALYRDTVMAGAGVSQGVNTGPLVDYFAPVLPYRHGTNRDDPPGTFKTDTVTVMYVPQTVAQTTLAGAGPADVTADIGVARGPGCPELDDVCGFRAGMTMLMHDGRGAYETFTVIGVQPSGLHIERAAGALTHTSYLPATTTLAQLTNVVYYLKTDPIAGTSQLVTREGVTGSDVPAVDHVVGLRFDYFGDPQPPVIDDASPDDSVGPRTTYGPPPPGLLEQISTGGYPAGENCTFGVDPATGQQVSRLPVLDGSSTASGLVLLTQEMLTDGPWCPDATSPNRWDADLLRIRTIGITLRIEAADAALRGPAGPLFINGGTARRSTRWLPDQTVRFQVTPRNLRK
jgi:type II secretory pathway pseudopilin PulG